MIQEIWNLENTETFDEGDDQLERPNGGNIN